VSERADDDLGADAPDPAGGDPAGGDPAGGDPADEARVVEDLLDSMAAGMEADRRADEPVEAQAAGAQSAEEAVAEAVELARRFEAERDEYLDIARRVQAEFENYKRRVDAQQVDLRAQAAADLVRDLLPVLDACDAAIAQGSDEVEVVRSQLVQTLEKRGLSTVDTAGVGFDPNVHEAVMHEDGDGEAVVVEVLRAGYRWNDRVVRAAMVRVRG
jgi:molecular chaperone GrpE